MKRNLFLFLGLIALLMESCSLVEGIFKAGAYTGIIIVVVIIIAIVFIAAMFRKRS